MCPSLSRHQQGSNAQRHPNESSSNVSGRQVSTSCPHHRPPRRLQAASSRGQQRSERGITAGALLCGGSAAGIPQGGVSGVVVALLGQPVSVLRELAMSSWMCLVLTRQQNELQTLTASTTQQTWPSILSLLLCQVCTAAAVFPRRLPAVVQQPSATATAAATVPDHHTPAQHNRRAHSSSCRSSLGTASQTRPPQWLAGRAIPRYSRL